MCMVRECDLCACLFYVYSFMHNRMSPYAVIFPQLAEDAPKDSATGMSGSQDLSCRVVIPGRHRLKVLVLLLTESNGGRANVHLDWGQPPYMRICTPRGQSPRWTFACMQQQRMSVCHRENVCPEGRRW